MPSNNKLIIGTQGKKDYVAKDRTEQIYSDIKDSDESFKGNVPKVHARKGSKLEKKTEESQIINPSLQSNKDFWTIDNVQYRNGFYKVNLLKEFLGNGNSKTQDSWAEYSKEAQSRNDFYVGDFPLYHSLFTSLYKLKDKPEIEEIISFLETKFYKKWLMTLTRIKYSPAGKDEIVHNYKMPDEYSIYDNFIGPNEYVKNSVNKINYVSLLGTDNLKEINEVYNWITKKDAYLWRLNSKPKSLDEKVALFDANTGGAILGCFRGIPSNSYSVLGVFAVKKS
jgi:hypothetical protein